MNEALKAMEVGLAQLMSEMPPTIHDVAIKRWLIVKENNIRRLWILLKDEMKQNLSNITDAVDTLSNNASVGIEKIEDIDVREKALQQLINDTNVTKKIISDIGSSDVFVEMKVKPVVSKVDIVKMLNSTVNNKTVEPIIIEEAINPPVEIPIIKVEEKVEVKDVLSDILVDVKEKKKRKKKGN